VIQACDDDTNAETTDPVDYIERSLLVESGSYVGNWKSSLFPGRPLPGLVLSMYFQLLVRVMELNYRPKIGGRRAEVQPVRSIGMYLVPVIRTTFPYFLSYLYDSRHFTQGG
jgi:hypothetical protein